MCSALHIAVILLVASQVNLRANAQTAPAGSPASLPATLPARPDEDLWARRNIQLIRDMAERAAPPGRGEEQELLLVEFSLIFNRMLIREPYAGEVRKIAERARAAETDPERRMTWDRVVKFLELPEQERYLRLAMDNSIELEEPIIDSGNELTLTGALAQLPDNPAYQEYAAKIVQQMDDVARKEENWDGLALAYHHLAYDARERQRGDLAVRYALEMVDILHHHPQFQDPRRGNTDGVSPQGVSSLLLDLNLRDELEKLIAAHDEPVKVELIRGLITELVRRGQVAEAREITEQRLRPLAPPIAKRIEAALDGQILREAPPATIQAKRRAGDRTAQEESLESTESTIAHEHARRGQVDVAAQMLVTLQQDRSYHRIGPDELAAHEWARLAYTAHQAGHDDAAQRAFDRALAALASEPTVEPEEAEEKTRFVREALVIGEYRLALRALSTTLAPGAWGRALLAEAYLDRGDVKRSRELIDETIEIAERQRGGSAMAEVAVLLHRLGDVERAEDVFLASLDHIRGEDFGLGGSADVVRSAVQMNRLDLLERLYKRSDLGERMLLCIAVCNLEYIEEHLDDG